MMAIIKKELLIIFRQPLIYILAAIFSLVAGVLFYSILMHYINDVQNQLPQLDSAMKLQVITNQLLFPLIGNINFLMMVLAPAMVMNAISDEYRQCTFPLLNHSVFSPWYFIFSKFTAYTTALLFILSTIAIFPLILWYAGIYEYSFLYSGFFAIALNIIFFVALGLWCSSLSEYPVLAMFLTYVVIMFHWLFPTLKQLTTNLWWINVFNYLSCSRHFELVLKGDLKLSSLGFYLIHTALFLFFARLSWSKRVLQ